MLKLEELVKQPIQPKEKEASWQRQLEERARAVVREDLEKKQVQMQPEELEERVRMALETYEKNRLQSI